MSRRHRAAYVVVSLSAFACALDTGQVDTFGSGYSVGDDASHDDDDGGTGDDGTDDGVESGPVDGGEDDGAPGAGDCCVGHDAPGCGDQAMQTCVCAQDPFCCDTKWDDLCATLVEKNGCGLCDGPMDDGGGIDDGGASEGGPVEDGGGSEGGPVDDGGGIDDGGGTDDGGGVDDGGGIDDGGGTDGGGEAGGGVGDCCSAHAGTGCTDGAIEACVCGQDDYCCTTEWDGICVGEVDSLGCGVCGGDEAGGSEGGGTTDDGGGEADDGAIDPGDCCIAHAGIGCTEPSIEACVCGADDYCCTTEWDGICVDEVDQFGCGTCV